MKKTSCYYGILVSDMVGFWLFEEDETADKILELCDEESEGLDYILPESGEGAYLISLTACNQEQAVQEICQKASYLLSPSTSMIEALKKATYRYTFQWDEDGDINVVEKEIA